MPDLAPDGGFERRPATSVESSGGRSAGRTRAPRYWTRVRTHGPRLRRPRSERRRRGGDADRGGPGARRAPRHAPARRLAPLRDRAGRRHRPARVPQRRRRPRRPGRPDPERGVDRAPVRAQGARARVRASARERWGPRELDLDLLVFGRARVTVERPPAADRSMPTTDPAKAAKLLEVPHPAAARASVRARAARRPRARARAARLGRDRRDRPAPPGTDRGRRTRSARSATGTPDAAGGDRCDPTAGPLSPGSASAAPSRRHRPSGPRSTRYARASGRDATTSASSVPWKTSAAPSSAAYPAGIAPSAIEPVVDRPPVLLAVVVRRVAAGHEPEPAGQGGQPGPERIGRPGLEPAQRPGRQPGHDDARTPTPFAARGRRRGRARSRACSRCCRRRRRRRPGRAGSPRCRRRSG